MKTAEQMAADVKAAFLEIYETSLKGLPIVNPMLDVETIGFQEFEGRAVGIIITPWLMTLAVFPKDGETMDDVTIGDEKSFDFPYKKYKFLANEIEGLGPYWGYAMYSPMHEFEHHPHAVARAEAFMETLMEEHPDPESELDEERLARFLAGENFEDIKRQECESAKAKTPVDGEKTLSAEEIANQPESPDRRAFLSGGLRA